MASKKTNIQSPENYDRFIDDKERRNKGQFYTPKIFADYAHKMISEALGNNWKDEYVVWDNCCGTKNLTRDYKFKELYCSTLEKEELDISAEFNTEAVSFQFDFLNEPIAGRESLTGVYDDKLPKGLKDALLENKPIVFFINPPYGAPGRNDDETIKTFGGIISGACDTVINSEMKSKKFGRASTNLYAQFVYRLIMIKQKYNLSNCYIAFFSPTLFLTGPSFYSFRNELFNDFVFIDGIQFKASHFADVSSTWGISFSLWKAGKQIDKNNFLYKIVDVVDNDIKVIDNKLLYNTDNCISASDWVKTTNTKNKIEVPLLRNAITVAGEGKIDNDFIGYFLNNSNNVGRSISFVGLFNTGFSGGHGVNVCKENFEKTCALFSARKLIENNWINSKDEYLAPNESHLKFQEFTNDSIVYSLFNGASNQSSLRQIKYNDKLWNIKNEFFWMSKSEIESLALKYNNDYCFNDAHSSSERFVYTKLQTISLSPEAQDVMDKANDIVRKTFKYRESFNKEHPEYQINNWDCGWYQIKKLCKEYMPELLKEFKEVYKVLADKTRPMVYELGFLK